MSEKYGFFNDSGGDRQYGDTDFADMFSLFVGNSGYLSGKDDELEVIDEGSGLKVTVKTGAAWLGSPAGWWYINDEDLDVTLDSETAGQDRIDRIVVRLDRSTENRKISIETLKGTPNISPAPETITQNEMLYELSLAQVYITGGSTGISVTDERDSEYCGKVSVGGGDTELPGVIKLYAGATAPDGWIICDGSEISRSTYAGLFAVIGTQFGVGDGSTTFNLPDIGERAPVGYKSGSAEFGSLGATYGEKEHQLTVAELASHNHSFKYTVSYAGGPLDANDGTMLEDSTFVYFSSDAIINAGDDSPHNNIQPSIALNYIIKT